MEKIIFVPIPVKEGLPEEGDLVICICSKFGEMGVLGYPYPAYWQGGKWTYACDELDKEIEDMQDAIKVTHWLKEEDISIVVARYLQDIRREQSINRTP